MLNSIIKFLYKDSTLRTRKALSNIQKLFNSIDYSIYKENEIELLNRIWIIKTTLKGRLQEGLENNEMVMSYCREDPECDDYKSDILQVVVNEKPLSYAESKYLLKQIEDRLNFGYALAIRDVFNELFNQMNPYDLRSFKSIMDDLYEISVALVNMKRRNATVGADQEFSLQEDVFKNVLADAMAVLKNRNRIFITGIQRLNTILAPGYIGGRLYTYLAFPGGGKSQILLDAALDIKKYNKDIKCDDSDKRPAVLFITLENSIEETIERIFNIVASDDDIRNYTPKQVEKMLRERGELFLADKNGIDIIIRYYKNRSIDVNDIYGIIQDLADDGIEVVSLIVDYLKRLRPIEKGDSEKEELKNISNELKDLATILRIPVITAQQLNRTSSAIVDAALQAKKEDVTRLVGRDGVAGAWEIIENSDVVIVINKEKKADTGDLYLTFKLLKRRYASHESDATLRELEYFNHPYDKGSSIRLVPDIDMDEPISLTSLSSQFVPAEVLNGGRGKKNAVQRKSTDDEDDEFLVQPGDFEPFEFGKKAVGF
jgi:ribosomal silencing factor RsfS